jgi:hypothetical protein
MNRSTHRTLIIRKPDLNNFERYKIDPTPVYENLKKMPAFKQFMSHNPLPYYLGEPKVEGGNHMEGEGFWSDFARGFETGLTKTLEIGSKVLPLIGLGEEMQKKKKGGKKKIVKEESSESESEKEELAHEKKENKKLKKIKKVVQEMQEENKKIMKKPEASTPAVKGKGSKAARGALVKKLMKEKGMKLGEASRYIKEHNLLK